MATKAGTATVDAVAAIWQRVLRRSSIGTQENFFDLCTDDSLADAIFAGIMRVFGRELPAATICYASTISALAAVLEQPILPTFSPLVQLKAGTDKTPIFIAPGVGGRASFSGLARSMNTEFRIYGIQARGVEGIEAPLERIEDMAEFYLKAILQVQAQGPYFLIGYSFGGLVALEMAQRIALAGQRVALLTLIDTYPHPRYLPWGERLRFGAKRIKGALSYRRLTSDHQHRALDERYCQLSFAETTRRVKQSDFVALARYRPKLYKGSMRFVAPEADAYLPSDPVAVWKNLTEKLIVETVPGNHLKMVAEHSEKLAAVLSRYVREASEGYS